MKSGFEPKILICSECGEEFVFTCAAQEYFAERGYTEDPKRCKSCHTQYKKSQREQRRSPATVITDVGITD
ncbi:MAG: zinc-ribbon domain containing protein [candidate division Zixibacteria bacterium]|nr:zinc-ribbon domain containing protein [candidate division Zixibacteria bacterium]MCK4606246.1 zinc-ribbon domain containing protein [candidate division Zixibacteria bacterium]